jgi:hypothetical protein
MEVVTAEKQQFKLLHFTLARHQGSTSSQPNLLSGVLQWVGTVLHA